MIYKNKNTHTYGNIEINAAIQYFFTNYNIGLPILVKKISSPVKVLGSQKREIKDLFKSDESDYYPECNIQLPVYLY